MTVIARLEGVVADLTSLSGLLAQSLRVVSASPPWVSDGFWRPSLR
jgi:hypothetical protein